MFFELFVTPDISDPTLSRDVKEYLENLANVKIIDWGEKTEKTSPHIILLDDRPGDDIALKVTRIHQSHPTAALFVISPDTRPEHIVEVMKAGASEFFFQPLDQNKLTGAIEKIRTQIQSSSAGSKGHLYSFISSKGGIGSTLITTNTAVALAQNQKGKIALIDMSLQSGDVSALLDLPPGRNISDICQNFNRLDAGLLTGVMAEHSAGVRILAAPNAPEESENIYANHISAILKLSRSLFPVTVVDCASMSVNDRSYEIFQASEKIFVVTDVSVPAIRNMIRLTGLLQKKGIDRQKIEVVVNRFLKGNAATLDEIERTFKKKVFWLFPNDFDAAIESINRGVPLVKSHSGTVLAKNIIDFCRKLTDPAFDPAYRGFKGLFGKSL
ncbi:MAG: response regulator/pilus assembly protein [Desulfuromonadaceae bacterium]|nr:response regulator/pilus assembly protein [Desulfuromonadaceae bacterium]